MEDKEQKKTPDGKNFDEDYVTEENSGIKSSVVRARLYRMKKAIGKVEPVHREKQSVREVTDLRYYLDGYLKDNLDEVPKFLAKAWDCVIIVSGNAKVRIGKSTIAMQIAYYLAWLLNEQRKKKGEVPQDTLVPFTNENVAFDPEELMKKAITLPRHSVLVYDEGRAGLDSARAMENINKATQDFFQECGALGHIIIIVLPDFFKLQETIAVSRSLFLINCYTDKNYNRGFFSFYSEHKKELLYILGKKRYGSTSKYFAVEPNFHGPFVNYFPLDKAIYDENKKKALRKRRKSKLEHKWRLERDSLIYILYKNGNFTTEQIAKHLTNISGVPCSTILIDRAIETITKAVKRENIDYEEDENEDNS